MKSHVFASIKIAVTALLAIFISGELGLKNSSTAGIITILSIRSTKKDTLQAASSRALAYLCGLFLAKICFQLLGFRLPAFAVFLFFFTFICLAAGWQEAIGTCSVLVSHFLIEQSMSLPMLINETLLLFIGAGLGVLVNLHLHRREADFTKLADDVDDRIRGILRKMSADLLTGPNAMPTTHFQSLEAAIRRAKLLAGANYNNSLFHKNTYELDYMRMREQQTVVLKGICKNIQSLEHLPGQASAIARLLAQMEQAYHKENTGTELQASLQNLKNEMKQERLPSSREEFEARAILFYILMQLDELIAIKQRFMLELQDSKKESSRRL